MERARQPRDCSGSNATEDGRPIGVRRAGENWHSDMCYTARPPRGTMLYALEVPNIFGLALGDTEFANAAEAWDALPQPIKQRIDGRRAVFDFSGRKRAFPPTRAESTAFRRSGTRSSGCIPIPGASACT